MRQIVLDTETTGLEVSLGHRIIEIGCVELVDRRVTGEHWHFYFNPDREVDTGAFEVHGIGCFVVERATRRQVLPLPRLCRSDPGRGPRGTSRCGLRHTPEFGIRWQAV